MKKRYDGKYIFTGTDIGFVIWSIVAIFTNKLIIPVLCTSIAFFFGAILEGYKNKKQEE